MAAERELRAAIDLATEMGAARYVALYRTRIAHVLLAQGRDEDARAELEQAREISGDAAAWKSARARILARRGELDEAVELAREAERRRPEATTSRCERRSWSISPRCWRATGDSRGAAQALAEAVSLHEEKGNVLNAQHCRELLAGIATPAS